MAEGRSHWLVPPSWWCAIVVAASVWLMPERRHEVATASAPTTRPPASKPAPAPAPIEDVLVDNLPRTGDLDGMVKRRLVRMLVVPNRTDYFLDGGTPKGLVAEYGARVERRLNRRFQTGARPVRVVYVPVQRG